MPAPVRGNAKRAAQPPARPAGPAAPADDSGGFADRRPHRYTSPMPPLYAPPVKRSITIAGHETALTLEPVFWDALRSEAVEQNLPLNALVARIDAERITALDPPNLASAVRCWLFAHKKTS